MLAKNVGTVDRVVRVALGIALLSLLVGLDGPVRFVGLIGLVPLLTAALGTCPIYTMLGLRTCPIEPKQA